jgi:ribosomal protein L28
MHRVYTIVKKNSIAHQTALASRFFKKAAIVLAGHTHVLIPSHRSIDFGHNVSHAKNRTRRARMSNMQPMTLEMGGRKISIKLSAHDLRTYKKVTAPASSDSQE